MDLEDFIGACLHHMLAYQRPLSILLFMKVLSKKILEYKIASTMENDEESVKEASDFVGMMLAAATSKTCATTLAYPHEVVRTRLREEGTKYRSFFQTLSLVVQEEGYGSLYRGLTTHLVRQIPNTAIMMATYELVVYLLNG